MRYLLLILVLFLSGYDNEFEEVYPTGDFYRWSMLHKDTLKPPTKEDLKAQTFRDYEYYAIGIWRYEDIEPIHKGKLPFNSRGRM